MKELRHIPNLTEDELITLLEVQNFIETTNNIHLPRHINKKLKADNTILMVFVANLVPLFFLCWENSKNLNLSINDLFSDSTLRASIILISFLLIIFSTMIFSYLQGKFKKQKKIFLQGKLYAGEITEIKRLYKPSLESISTFKVFVKFKDEHGNYIETFDIVRSRQVLRKLQSIPFTGQKQLIDIIYAPKIAKKRVLIPLKLVATRGKNVRRYF